MYEYHSLGWVNLMKLTNLNVGQLHNVIKSLGIKSDDFTFLKWRTEGTINPEYLKTICNHFRFPISDFVLVNGIKPNEDKCRIFSEDEWKMIELRYANLIKFCNYQLHLQRPKAMARIGCGNTIYYKLKNHPDSGVPRITFTQLLSYISNVRIYAGDVIIDNNAHITHAEKLTPFYNDEAKAAFYDAFEPETQVSNVAENIFDVFQFVRQYFNSESLLGDNNIYHITGKTMNEIGSAQNKLYRENVELKSKISILEKEIERLKKKRD